MKQLRKYCGVVELLNDYNHAMLQCECPRCHRRSNAAPSSFDPLTDPDAFKGWYRYELSGILIVIFNCPNCSRLFWFHFPGVAMEYLQEDASEGRLDPRVVEDADEK